MHIPKKAILRIIRGLLLGVENTEPFQSNPNSQGIDPSS